MIYSDIDLTFDPHPVTGDIMRKFDTSAIQDSMRNIIMCNPFDKPFYPAYGVGIMRYLFEIQSPGISIGLKREIKEQMRIFEPRVNIQDVLIGLNDDDSVEIEIHFYVIGIIDSQRFNLSLERNR